MTCCGQVWSELRLPDATDSSYVVGTADAADAADAKRLMRLMRLTRLAKLSRLTSSHVEGVADAASA